MHIIENYSKNKPYVALSFLSKALLESEAQNIPDKISYSKTLLNICAILSKLKK